MNENVVKLEEKKGLKIHAVVTIGVAALLTAINLAACPAFLWFFFPLAGMSIGLGAHYLGVKNVR